MESASRGRPGMRSTEARVPEGMQCATIGRMARAAPPAADRPERPARRQPAAQFRDLHAGRPPAAGQRGGAARAWDGGRGPLDRRSLAGGGGGGWGGGRPARTSAAESAPGRML
jgi:hypothetical protein